MPLIDTPFERVAIDIIGPIFPHTDRKNRYILTMVDYATRYPEVTALPSIETERVTEALVDMFSRVGLPEEVLTDCVAQFTSDLMAEIGMLLSFKQLRTTPYHPMCNGSVEKSNGALTQMLWRMCAEKPKDWDRYLNALLFAYREVPQESLGFSPFELLYGRTVRGPMRILRELWSDEVVDEKVKTTYQYVVDLRGRLESTCRIAQDELVKSSRRYTKYYNRGTRSKKFDVGNQALVLLPTNNNKLLVQWKGSYEVKQVKGEIDYIVAVEGKSKTFHANMLKLYVARPGQTSDKGILNVVCVAVIEDGSSDEAELDSSKGLPFEYPIDVGKECIDQKNVCPDLSEGQRTQIMEVFSTYSDVFTERTGSTNLIRHEIKFNTSESIRIKGYGIPFNARETINEEVTKMLDQEVIEPSNYPYSSHVVLVKRKAGTNRFCIDFLQLNKITVFDAEPMNDMESVFSKLAGHKYISKLDLSKGYWQIPISDNSRNLTAFTTPKGLFQFKVMPFGLVNVGASCVRLMRKLLNGMENVDSFVDDICLHTYMG